MLTALSRGLGLGLVCVAAGCIPTMGPGGSDGGEVICALPDDGAESEVVQYSEGGCVEFQPGTMPLILSMPHGGYLLPDEIPDRVEGTTVNDAMTQELGREVADFIEARTGLRPYLIINRLDRVKLDPNRDMAEGAEGSPEGEAEWAAYHGFIEASMEEIRLGTGAGFYVDLHGQSHDPGRSQLGFSTTGENLTLSDDTLNSGGYADWSSLGPWVESSPSSFAQLLRGEKSLGGRLEAAGYSAVPSPASPSPGDGVTYWNTGYSSYTHGPLQEAPWMGTVLFETAYTGIRDSRRNRQAFAEDLAGALLAFFEDHQ